MADVLIACEARVRAQVLLGAELVRGLGLVLDYLVESGQQCQLCWEKGIMAYSDVMQLHDCGIGWGKRDSEEGGCSEVALFF